jgi:hypothetical protein
MSGSRGPLCSWLEVSLSSGGLSLLGFSTAFIYCLEQRWVTHACILYVTGVGTVAVCFLTRVLLKRAFLEYYWLY